MNRGSLPLGVIEAIHPSSFNEAPIHESGKYQHQRKKEATMTQLQ